VLILLAAPGCSKLKRTDLQPLDQSGMWYEKVQELKGLGITDAEVAEVLILKQTGISDAGCVELFRQARAENHPFADASVIAELTRARVAEPVILQLGQMKQLPAWAGEAVTLRLTGLSDQVPLAVGRRRAAGQAVLSSPVIAKLKNVEMTEPQILDYINRGMSDAQAEQIIAAKRRAAGSTGFIRQRGRRPR